MNIVKINGRTYRPESKQTKSGKTLTTFGLSVYTGKDKDGKSKYSFIDCKFFGNVQEKKDVELDGYIAFDSWTDKSTGKQKTKPYIMVKEMKDFVFNNQEDEINF